MCIRDRYQRRVHGEKMQANNQNAINQDSELERILEMYNKSPPKKTKNNPSAVFAVLQRSAVASSSQMDHNYLQSFGQYAPGRNCCAREGSGALERNQTFNREYRKIAGFPIGVLSKPCQCCKKWERKFHMCSHLYCPKPCKKMELFIYKLRKRAKRKLNALGITDRMPLTQDMVEFQLRHIMEDLEQVLINPETLQSLSLIHISEPTRPLYISYAVFCLKKKKPTSQTLMPLRRLKYPAIWCRQTI
eukprot:TRINITY_DN1583_c0_g1_i2.p2 TRINITY_DN1583_c0_g1~~TRINITY_DN1583_c0_g1_i2.p2  ORF type:complete len:247 (-),score=42.37 TRINITY_DN1583_c0_g1_i2:58-798(-)